MSTVSHETTRRRVYRLLQTQVRHSVLVEAMRDVQGELFLGADRHGLIVAVLEISADAPRLADELHKFTACLSAYRIKWSKVEFDE